MFMLAASVFKPEQYDLKDFTHEIYRNEWIGEIDLWTLFYVSGLVRQANIACAHDSYVSDLDLSAILHSQFPSSFIKKEKNATAQVFYI